ncbi:MAG: F0F1 ATP synthase subunit B [Opitutales bacterium]|nr:F0F1 ATP synthase subunit B [Opitutales bacterium]
MNAIFGMDTGGLVVIFDKFGINVPLLAVQMVNFALVAYLLYRFAFRDVIKSMDKRNQEIQDGLRYGEKMKSELASIDSKRTEILSKANSEATDIVSDAQKTASDLMLKEKQASKELSQSIIAKAHADIENERNAMFEGLKGEIKGIVVQAAEQVLSRELSETERAKYREQAAQMLIQNC